MEDRAKRDEREIETAGASLEQSWVALQRKTKEYEKLKDEVFDEDPESAKIMVDFLKKAVDEGDDEAEETPVITTAVSLTLLIVDHANESAGRSLGRNHR